MKEELRAECGAWVTREEHRRDPEHQRLYAGSAAADLNNLWLAEPSVCPIGCASPSPTPEYGQHRPFEAYTNVVGEKPVYREWLRSPREVVPHRLHRRSRRACPCPLGTT